MIKSRIAAAVGLLTVAGAASADISVPLAVTSDYDFRGLTQTDENFAVQAGLTYTDDSGFYVGAWASNIDFPGLDGDFELDGFLGYAGGDAEESFGYDVGAIVYAYPGSDDLEEVVELYAGITKGWFGAKVWFSPDNYGETSWYTEGNVTIPLPANFSVSGHVGYSFGDYWDGIEYLDYSLGVNYTISNFTLNAKWVDTDISGADTDRFIFTVSTTLPWASE
jgi:uncharacterized protein (TIGR02001 family)